MNKDIIVSKTINNQVIHTLADINNSLTVNIEKNQEANLVFLSRDSEQSKIDINLHDNSVLSIIFISFARNEKADITINLLGSDSVATIKSLLIANNDYQSLSLCVNHQAKNTKSDLYLVGIANNSSKTIINSSVKIEKNMKNANTYQKIVGSILDDKSVIEADPILLIDEYDVVAGHGAAVGKMDKEALFYLMSRGVSLKDAKTILLNSLMTNILDVLEDEKIKEEIIKRIQE